MALTIILFFLYTYDGPKSTPPILMTVTTIGEQQQRILIYEYEYIFLFQIKTHIQLVNTLAHLSSLYKIKYVKKWIDEK